MTRMGNLDFGLGLALGVSSAALGPLTGVPALILARGALDPAGGDRAASTRARAVKTAAILGMALWSVVVLALLVSWTNSGPSIASVVESRF